jgi:hypothetical protein
MKRETNEFILMLVMIACILVCACACDMRILDSRDSSDTTESAKSTEQTIPTPTPTIVEPQDIPLFEEGYYAVLPGEGVYYNVFDCYGNPVGSFLYYELGMFFPSGIMTEKELTYIYRFNQKDVQTVLPLKDKLGFNTLHSSVNGFYQVDQIEGQVALYNTEGQHTQTFTCPWDVGDYAPISVTYYGDETVVSLSQNDVNIAVYFVALDGTITDTCIFKDIDNHIMGILGRKYIVVSHEFGGQDCDLYDTDGNLVKKNVSIAVWYDQYVSYPVLGSLDVLDYYTSEGQTFDASFQPVKKNTVEADGALIYGVEYDVEGITCKAEKLRGGYYLEGHWVEQELVAVGTSGDQMAIKTTEEEYVITCNDMQFYDINNHVLVLLDSQGAYQVVSLDTGAVVYTIESDDNFVVANEYIYTRSSEYDEGELVSYTYSIIDKDGMVSYSAQNIFFRITEGEYIILYRGPYVGIADLNGDWIIKTLASRYTRNM